MSPNNGNKLRTAFLTEVKHLSQHGLPETMDDKYDSGTGAAARSARVDGKENKKETLQQSNRKKSQTRKGRAKKKLIE